MFRYVFHKNFGEIHMFHFVEKISIWESTYCNPHVLHFAQKISIHNSASWNPHVQGFERIWKPHVTLCENKKAFTFQPGFARLKRKRLLQHYRYESLDFLPMSVNFWESVKPTATDQNTPTTATKKPTTPATDTGTGVEMDMVIFIVSLIYHF